MPTRAEPQGVMFTPGFDRFFKTHEKVMWRFSAFDFKQLRADLLRREDLDALRGALLVESHNPVYTERLLEYFRLDHEMSAFLVTWAYEEMKHYAVLRTYLEATGLVDVTELESDLVRSRAGELGPEAAEFTPLQFYVYAMLQEQMTAVFYRRFADYAEEPLLEAVLRLIAKDEYRHCQYYLQKARRELNADHRRIQEVDEVILTFQMPGPTFVVDYARHAKAMLRVGKTMDTAALTETMDKLGQLTGRRHLMKLATDRVTPGEMPDQSGAGLSMLSAARRRLPHGWAERTS